MHLVLYFSSTVPSFCHLFVCYFQLGIIFQHLPVRIKIFPYLFYMCLYFIKMISETGRFIYNDISTRRIQSLWHFEILKKSVSIASTLLSPHRNFTCFVSVSVCSPGTYGQNCSQKCNCSKGEPQVCHHVTGTCTCLPGLFGAKCDQRKILCSSYNF